jgi:acyl-coenzyme A synthetase/AMP-(fatty) acid ligase
MPESVCKQDAVINDQINTVTRQAALSSPLHMSIFANQADLSWLQSHSGDWYYFVDGNTSLQHDEYIWLVCKSSSAHNVTGYRLANKALELAVMQLAAVEDVVVIGLPDEQKGNAIHVIATLKNNSLDKAKLTTAISARISESFGDFVKPTAITFVDQLPEKSVKENRRQQLKSEFILLQRAA